MINKYTKIPLEIEALQWKNNDSEMFSFCPYAYVENNKLILKTSSSVTKVFLNDYVIKFPNGEFTVCNPATFKRTHKRTVQFHNMLDETCLYKEINEAYYKGVSHTYIKIFAIFFCITFISYMLGYFG